MVSATSESHGMAKKQRSIQLPEDIYLLADAFEQRTGARFNRQVLAAMMQFLCADVAPDSVWIEFAVEVERANLEVAETMLRFAERKLLEAKWNVEFWEAEVSAGKVGKDAVQPWYRQKRLAYAKVKRIREIMATHDEPRDAIIAEWKRIYSSQRGSELSDALPANNGAS